VVESFLHWWLAAGKLVAMLSHKLNRQSSPA
jgi:hypothetical protein